MNEMNFSKIDLANLHQSKKIIGGSAAVAIVGSVLPWATLPIIGSVSGTRVGGWITIVAFAIVLAAMLEGDSKAKISAKNGKIALGVSILGAVFIAFKFIDIFNAMSQAGSAGDLFGAGFKVSIGIGLWLTAAAALVALVFLAKEMKGGSSKPTESK